MGCMKVMDMVCGSITLPRNLVIKNLRLGFIHRVLQIAILLYIILSIYTAGTYRTSYLPSPYAVDLWTSSASPSRIAETADHCTKLADYNYIYSSTYSFTPSDCRVLPSGESYIQTPGTMYFPTFATDTSVTEFTGAAQCNDATQCKSMGGVLEPPPNAEVPNQSCKCTRLVEFFVRNAEQNYLQFNHGYDIVYTNGQRLQIQRKGRSSSNSATDTDISTGTTTTYERKMLTITQDHDGADCAVGAGYSGQSAKARWDKDAAQNGIVGSVEEWLKCAGEEYNLDLTSADMSSNNAVENHPPHLRITGVTLNVGLTYYNSVNLNFPKDVQDYDMVCIIRISAVPAWNMVNTMQYNQLPQPGQTEISYRQRKSYGVAFKFEAKGAFDHVDPAGFMTLFVNALVLLTLPGKVIALLAVMCVGSLSAIYNRAQTETLDLEARFHGHMSRTMGYVQTFKAMSGVDGKLSRKEFDAGTQEIFQDELKDGGSLNHDELGRMVSFIMLALDPSGSNDVSLPEFLNSVQSNETVGLKELSNFFDKERKVSILEKLLSDVDLSARRASNKISPETPSESE